MQGQNPMSKLSEIESVDNRNAAEEAAAAPLRADAAAGMGELYIPSGVLRVTAENLRQQGGTDCKGGKDGNGGIENVRRIVLPDGVEEIGNYCFSGLHALEEVVFPRTVRKVGCGIFQHCWRLKRAVLPEGTRQVDEMFFYGCGDLNVVSFPGSVSFIAREALRTCVDLTGVLVMDDRFPDCPRQVQRLAAFTCMDGLNGRCGELAGRADFVEESCADECKAGYESIEALEDQRPNTAAYVRARAGSLLDIAIAKGDGKAAAFLIDGGLIKEVDLQRFTDRASRERRVEIAGMLLREKGRHRSGEFSELPENPDIIEEFSW